MSRYAHLISSTRIITRLSTRKYSRSEQVRILGSITAISYAPIRLAVRIRCIVPAYNTRLASSQNIRRPSAWRPNKSPRMGWAVECKGAPLVVAAEEAAAVVLQRGMSQPTLKLGLDNRWDPSTTPCHSL